MNAKLQLTDKKLSTDSWKALIKMVGHHFCLAYVLCREEVVILLEDGSQQTSIGKSELFKSMAAVQICPYPINSLLNLQYNLSNCIVNFAVHFFFLIVKARFSVSLQWSRFIEFYSAYYFSNFCLVIGFSPIYIYIYISNVAIHVRTLQNNFQWQLNNLNVPLKYEITIITQLNLTMTFEPLWICPALLKAMLFGSKIIILLCKIYNEILSSFNFIYNI